MNNPYTELYDKQGTLLGVHLSPEAWDVAREAVLAHFGPGGDTAQAAEEPVASEPLSEWETLKQYWDFPYPVDMDVACSECGQSTEDWSADDPRKFRLTAANLAGLVSFTCLGCRSKIIKRHFKDRIKVEVHPFREKDQKKEARY